jgi:RHS repeat-associated protein
VAQIEHANNVALGGSNGTATEAVLYLRTDELATPREARNAAGTVVWSWYSAAFGDTNAAEDPDGNGQRTIVNLRFPGQYADQEAGLHYNWHRSYDPATGRYLESDPIGLVDGFSTYVYARSSPLNYSDQSGLQSFPPIPATPPRLRDFIPDLPPGFRPDDALGSLLLLPCVERECRLRCGNRPPFRDPSDNCFIEFNRLPREVQDAIAATQGIGGGAAGTIGRCIDEIRRLFPSIRENPCNCSAFARSTR